MDEEIIENATDEYLDIVNDKNKNFKRFTPLLPEHMSAKLYDEAKVVKQVKLTTSIFVRASVMNYLAHIKKLYNYQDSNIATNSLQVPLQLSEECYDDIEMISNITGIKHKLSIVKNAIEFSFNSSTRII